MQAAQNQLEQQFGSMHLDKEEQFAEEDERKTQQGESNLERIDESEATPRPEDEGAVAGEAATEEEPQEEAKEGEDGSGGSSGLKKDWGLEILVSVGQTWINSLLDADDMTVRLAAAARARHPETVHLGTSVIVSHTRRDALHPIAAQTVRGAPSRQHRSHPHARPTGICFQ